MLTRSKIVTHQSHASTRQNHVPKQGALGQRGKRIQSLAVWQQNLAKFFYANKIYALTCVNSKMTMFINVPPKDLWGVPWCSPIFSIIPILRILKDGYPVDRMGYSIRETQRSTLPLWRSVLRGLSRATAEGQGSSGHGALRQRDRKCRRTGQEPHAGQVA